ncbi:sensor histidine kinase [Roseovarius arcticus]|uniref:sensor histidine kinase n=1 Tax=Roseovarius arcticus TaxID=2547404 RepID=UPI0011105772|nr:PAS domain-containing protein [Roseovarius arcticus]
MTDDSSTALATMNPTEIVATLREGLLVLTEDLTVEFASDRFLKMFQVDLDETVGRALSDLGDGQWNIPTILDPLNAIVAQNLTFQDVEIEHHFDHIGRKVMRLNARKTVRADNSTKQILLAIDDVTEAADYSRELSRQRLLAESIVDTLREPLLVLDGDLQIIAASRAFYSKFEVDARQAIGKNLTSLGNGQWANAELIRLLKDVVPEHSTIEGYEITHDFPHIGTRTVILNAREIFSEGNNTKTLLLAIEDVTERRRLGAERDQALDRSNQLLEELNHRVMNSLSVIGSVISMEGRTMIDDACKAAFVRMRTRIEAIGTLYHTLSRSAAVDSVKANDYLSAIVRDTVTALEVSPGAITLDLSIDDFWLSTRIAVPLGLITNELATNSLKYAYEGRDTGILGLRVVTVEGGFEFTIWDDGLGIDEDAHVDSGLGQKLVEAFVQQLGGAMERISGKGGTIHTLAIPHSTLLQLQAKRT